MKNVLILSAAFIALFVAGELLYRYGKMKPELSRKLIHFGSGLITLLFPLLLDSHWQVLVLCVSFALILIGSLKFGFLPSINNIDRRSHGSILYPLAVYISFLFYDQTRSGKSGDLAFFYIPVLLLAVCDPIAALIGKKWHYGSYSLGTERKCLLGNFAFFLTAFVISLGLLILISSAILTNSEVIILSCALALGTAIAEGLSRAGSDNIFIPLSAIFILYMML